MWANTVSLIIAGTALYISIKSWQKSRAIYGIERRVVRQVTGTERDLHLDKMTSRLNQELSSGNFTVLGLYERAGDKDWELILGRINKLKEE